MKGIDIKEFFQLPITYDSPLVRWVLHEQANNTSLSDILATHSQRKHHRKPTLIVKHFHHTTYKFSSINSSYLALPNTC